MLNRLKSLLLAATIVIVTGLMITPTAAAGDSAPSFRQQNGLLPYSPPAWFLDGYFIARERDPAYVFGPVRNFVQAMGHTTTWLIEDLELNRLERASSDGPVPEYSVYLETVLAGRTEYWVFVTLPHESAADWFAARRAYHGRKAEGYYGKTRGMLERALSQGLKVKAEMRYFIEKGNISLDSPEDIIMNKYNYPPVFDLREGRRLGSAAETN